MTVKTIEQHQQESAEYMAALNKYLPVIGVLAAMEESQNCQCEACRDGTIHASDCAVHNMPAIENGVCDCAVKEQL
jgi:hypothetical protein